MELNHVTVLTDEEVKEFKQRENKESERKRLGSTGLFGKPLKSWITINTIKKIIN